MEEILRNRTFDALHVGDTASVVRVAGREDIELFASVSGDMNPAHLEAASMAADQPGDIVAHGIWTAALVSAVLGTKLPGPGTIHLGQDIHFLKPVFPGDTITATVTVREKRDGRQVVLGAACTNQAGDEVLRGTVTVIAPDRDIEWPRVRVPDTPLQRHNRYEAFVERARKLPPVRAAIVHPCSAAAISGAIEARDEGFIDPVLVGPEHKIRAAAEAAQLSIDGIEIDPVEHSHAAAARAVALAVAGKVSILVKGSLHTDELLGAVVAPDSGLRTERRVSHVYAMDVPAYAKPLIVTDAAINIQPTLEHKRDICQNAVDLLHILGVEEPRVAVLAAVETVNSKMPVTLDAAALTVMAARGQIVGARVDGPLAFDNAINVDAARTKGISSPVAGYADILLVPDLEAGNMLAKQLIYFAGATAAGLVLGARVPIVLTSRSDPLSARIASAALAKMVSVLRQPKVLPA